jgi:hypothetical protein
MMAYRLTTPPPPPVGKQEFRRTDFGSRLLEAEGEGGVGNEDESAEDRCG